MYIFAPGCPIVSTVEVPVLEYGAQGRLASSRSGKMRTAPGHREIYVRRCGEGADWVAETLPVTVMINLQIPVRCGNEFIEAIE